MKKYINWLAYISLFVAFIVGYVSFNNNNELSKLELLVDNNLQLGESDSGIYKVFKNEQLFGYLTIGESQGYGGPLRVAIVTDTSGVIVGSELVNSFETVSFLAKLAIKKYYEQYIGKAINDRFELKNDVQAVSGATVSSLAIANASREASYKIAKDKLSVPIPKIEKTWRFTPKEGIVVLIFTLGVIAVFIRKKQIRYISLFLGLIFIGFSFNASLSLTHFGRAILGYFPDIHTHIVWWLLMVGTLTIIIIWGRNVYCSTMCPFHATQILLNKISGINLKLPPKLARILAKTPFILLWLSLIIIFISANPTIASYEPFAMLFSLKGAGIQWYILPASLIGALFFSDFFCRFFCPVGGALRWMQKIRTKVITLISNK